MPNHAVWRTFTLGGVFGSLIVDPVDARPLTHRKMTDLGVRVFHRFLPLLVRPLRFTVAV
jgi:hypothetical protein